MSPGLQRVPSLTFVVLVCWVLSACGASFETTEIRDYRLAVLSDDPAMQTEFRNLISEFNHQADRHVLTYVDDPSDANSAIIVTPGLELRDGKVGWGQWLSEAKEDNPVFHAPGSKPKRRVEYSMRLEFDEEYIRTRMQSSTWNQVVEKQKLFFHEVGHGLEMNHHNLKGDIMYHDISGTKNFETFFSRVRSYMDN